MYKLFVIMILNALRWMNISSSGTSYGSDHENHEISHQYSHHIIPLVMVKWLPQGKYIEPWKVYVTQPHNRMVFSTLLIAKEVYLCPDERDHHEYSAVHSNEATTRDDTTPRHHPLHIPEHCLFPTSFDSTQIPQCNTEAIPVIERVTRGGETEDFTCGRGGIGKLYSFQYKYCFEPTFEQSLASFFPSIFEHSEVPAMNVMHFGLYVFCYDHHKKETIYTEHVILSPNFINESSFKREQEKDFSMETDAPGIFERDFETIRNGYIEKRAPMSERLDETHESNESTYLAHQLVPADDFVFAFWRKPTFHFLNVKPMHKKLVPLWDHICELIRLHAKKNSKHKYKITTGAFVISSEEHKEPHSVGGEEHLHVVPDLWIKMVQDLTSKEGVAFVLSNFIDKILDDYCNTDSCTFSNHKDHFRAESADAIRYIKCCPINEKIKHLFGMESIITGFLKIDVGIHHAPSRELTSHHGAYYVLRKKGPTHQESTSTPPSPGISTPSSIPQTTTIPGGKIKLKIVTDPNEIKPNTKGEGEGKDGPNTIPIYIPIQTLLGGLSKNINFSPTESALHPHTVKPQHIPPETAQESQSAHINTANPQEVNIPHMKTGSGIGVISSTQQQISQVPQQHNLDQQHSGQHILPLILLKLFRSYTEPWDVERDRHNKLTFYTYFGGTEHYFCPVEKGNAEHDKKITKAMETIRKRNEHGSTPEKKKIPEDIFERCLVSKHFGENEVQKCDHEAIPMIKRVTQDSVESSASELPQTRCGPAEVQGFYYNFHYDVCRFNGVWQEILKFLKKKTSRLRKSPFKEILHYGIYKFCYDHEHKETIYTTHEIRSPKLIGDPNLELERKKVFDMRADGHEYFGNDFEEYRNSLRENIMASEYEAQPLVPPDDLVFALWRKPTFHLVNMRPMHKKFIPLWDYINEKIRLHAKKHHRDLYVIYTGAFTIPKQGISGKYRIPDLWVKIIKNLDFPQAVAIVMSDHETHLHSYCQGNSCKLEVSGDLAQMSRHVCCCLMNDRIKQLFQSEWNINNLALLGIENLTVKQRNVSQVPGHR